MARVEQVTGLQWRFADLTARLGWFGPELAFSQVRVLDREGGELLSARAGRVGVDWFRMVRTFRAAARVTLYRMDGRRSAGSGAACRGRTGHAA